MEKSILNNNPIRFKKLLAVLLPVYIFLGINLHAEESTNLSISHKILQSMQVSPDINFYLLIELALISLLVYWFLFKKSLVTPRAPLLLVSTFFGFAMTFGKACETFSDPLVIMQGSFNFLITLVTLSSYSILAYFAFPFFSEILDTLQEKKIKKPIENSFIKFLENRPFVSSFCLLCFAWSPFLFAFFPGLFAPGDTLNQICQFFNIPEATSNSIVLINPQVLLNEHHPVIHTLLMGACTLFGITFFDSCNLGYFTYTLLQFLCVIATFSYGISFLKQYQVNVFFRFALLIFILIMPWFCEYALLGTKDTLFACSLLLLCLSLIKLATNHSMRYLDWILLVISLLGFCLLKKSYIVLAVVLLLLVIFRIPKIHKLGLIKTSTLALIIVLLIQNIAFPFMQVSPGSPREMLSIPAQQTARCVVFHEDQLSQNQKDTIDKVFDYSAMQSSYNPYISDPIKNTYNKYATKEDLKNYFSTWAELLSEFPSTCVSATLMNYYGYFYPTTIEKYDYNLDTSRNSIYQINDQLNFSHLDTFPTNILNKLFIFGQEFWNTAPVISLFTQGSTYVWVLTFLSLYLFQRRHFARFSVLPVVLVLLVTLIGPCNFIVRYIFPIAFVVPFLLLISLAKPPMKRKLKSTTN